MAITKTIEWGDGSGDNIYLTYPSASGDQTVEVSSDANTGSARTKTVTFSASGVSPVTLTVNQDAGGPAYVMNGLVFWLDGIDKGGTTTWVDKINGYVFTNNGATFNSDHVYFDGTTSYLSSSSAVSYGNSGGGYMIEVVYDNEGDSGAILWPRNARYTICLNIIDYNLAYWQYGRGARNLYIVPSKGSISISPSLALANGMPMEYDGSSYAGTVDQDNIIIGANGNLNNLFKGKIYSIRIYNRNLSQAEVLQNYEVDKERFNLGPSYNMNFLLSSYDANTSVSGTHSNPDRAYNVPSSTTASQIYLVTGAQAETYVYYTFDTSAIPADATNITVSCSVKATISNASTSNIPIRNVQLFSGTTPKGTASSELATSGAVYELPSVSLTRAELANIRLRAYAKRGNTNTATNYYLRVYGAELTVNYTV